MSEYDFEKIFSGELEQGESSSIRGAFDFGGEVLPEGRITRTEREVTIVRPPSPFAPSAPVAVAATSVLSTSFSANWGFVTGANGYRLDVATDAGFLSLVSGYDDLDVGNISAHTVNLNIDPGTTYYYRVRAVNAGGSSGNSNTISLLTIPAAPVAITATSINELDFTANWLSSTGATGYRLDVATDALFTAPVAGFNNLDVGNVLTKLVDGLVGGTDYFYRVRAYNGSGTSSNSNVITVTTTTAFVPTDIAGCFLWLRSDLGITKDGLDRVSLWEDQSTAGNDLAQATDGNKPIWTANQLNGTAEITFDGTDDFMTNATINQAQPGTLFVVCRYETSVRYIFDSDNGANRWVFGHDLGVSAGNMILYAGDAVNFPFIAYTVGTTEIWCAIVNGASSSLRKYTGAPDTGNAGAQSMVGMVLGGQSVGHINTLHGGLYELIFYDSVLSEPNISLVLAYLNARYAIY